MSAFPTTPPRCPALNPLAPGGLASCNVPMRRVAPTRWRCPVCEHELVDQSVPPS